LQNSWFFVILNVVKDLNLIETLDSSLRSERHSEEKMSFGGSLIKNKIFREGDFRLLLRNRYGLLRL
jgi:hypothetical protein